jgi:transcription elongation factor GreA
MGISTQIALVTVAPRDTKWPIPPIGGEDIGSESRSTMLRTHPSRSAGGASSRDAASDVLPVTAAAYAALQRERDGLLHERLHQFPERLRLAREHGDAASNDEHLAIREEEAVLDARLARIEDILRRAEVVRAAESDDRVAIGSSVTVLEVDSGEAIDYVVESAHAAAKPRSVSAVSPVGRALLGRAIGDVVTVALPRKGRTRVLEILAIAPLPAA